jgi:hypothetical protein
MTLESASHITCPPGSNAQQEKVNATASLAKFTRRQSTDNVLARPLLEQPNGPKPPKIKVPIEPLSNRRRKMRSPLLIAYSNAQISLDVQIQSFTWKQFLTWLALDNQPREAPSPFVAYEFVSTVRSTRLSHDGAFFLINFFYSPWASRSLSNRGSIWQLFLRVVQLRDPRSFILSVCHRQISTSS